MFSWEVFAHWADVASVIGLGLSIWVLILTRGIRHRVHEYAVSKRFAVDKQQLCNELSGSIIGIRDDRPLGRQQRADINRQVVRIQSLNPILSKSDLDELKALRLLLQKPNPTEEEVNEIMVRLGALLGSLQGKGEYTGD